MGRKVKCPRCRHTFYVHGGGMHPDQSVVNCYECGNMFNPRKQSLPVQGDL